MKIRYTLIEELLDDDEVVTSVEIAQVEDLDDLRFALAENGEEALVGEDG